MATVHETYAAALRHDRETLPPDTRLVGVVRRPMGWFHGVVDENVPALGPPDELLDEVKSRQTELENQGLADHIALRQAWDDTDFAGRYEAYLDTNDEAAQAVNRLVNRVRGGTEVALVCFEAPDKPCHRHLLQERLVNRLDQD